MMQRGRMSDGSAAGIVLGAILVTGALVGLLTRGLALEVTHPVLTALILGLFALNTMVLAVSALTALAGLRGARSGSQGQRSDAVPQPVPAGRCAILWLVCGEPPEPLAARLRSLLRDLDATGQARDCDIFVLSDTQGAEARAREHAALAGVMARITYRNRAAPVDRKPGNLHDWLTRWGTRYEAMLVLDADSGFDGRRLAQLRVRMAADPRLGLIQSAIRLRPADSRFGAMQRLSARLAGPVFARGLARLSGDAGNYWGHNALIRVRAFAQVTPLPRLPGAAPLGGPVLSHDFIEAAHLRRAGWDVVICPDSRGSFEDAPVSVAAHLRRDRRWAQGNLQHLRLIGARGLHPVSRLHLAAGIMSYLSAPIWLALVLLTGSGAVHATAGVIWPLLGIVVLLLVPKLAGLLARPGALRRRARRRVMVRALWAELALTTLFAPLGMVQRTGFVAAIATGRSAGWVPSGQAVVQGGAPGRAAALAGAGIIACVALPQLAIAGPDPALLAALLVLPVGAPLLAAPWLTRWFDAGGGAGRGVSAASDAVARYYDASTRRFLRLGGSGAALAIHRPLWAEGVVTPAMAARHVNTLIADHAEAALEGAPARVVDLGCGVGGTVLDLARRWRGAEFCGVTISAEQVRLARIHARERGLDDRCRFLRSDFTLPTTLPRADLVIAVESHVHAPDAAVFLHAARRHLRPGGVLVVVDDMLARPETGLDGTQRRRLAQFRRGWRLGHVPDVDGLAEAARATGFDVVATRDLTGWLRLDRLRDRALRVVGPLADRAGLAGVPLFGNMIGGNALTESYRAGQMRYTLMVLRNRDDQVQPRLVTPVRAGAVA